MSIRSVVVLLLVCAVLVAQCQKPTTTKVKEAASKAASEGTQKVKEAASGFDFEAIQKQATDIAKSSFTSAFQAYLTAGHHAHKTATQLSDQYLQPEHAKFVKHNLLNVYGVAIAVAAVFVTLFLLSRLSFFSFDDENNSLSWLLSVYHSRAFFTTLYFGVVLTFLSLTILTGVDPLSLISKFSKENGETILHIVTGVSVWILLLNFFAVFKGGFLNFVSFLLSGGLFADALGIHPFIEGFVGTLPKYGLPAAVLALLSFIAFSKLAVHEHTHHHHEHIHHEHQELIKPEPKEEEVERKKDKKSK